MGTAVILLFASLALADPDLGAQTTPGPPVELAKLERLLGHWEGRGTFTPVPGGESAPWTSTSSVRRAMNGFFLQEDLVIDLGPGAPSPIVFRSFHGYDRENRRYMTLSLGNVGPPSATEVHWADEDTMVSVEPSVEDGQVVVERWITWLEPDAIRFAGYRSLGVAEPYVHVEGRMTRAEKPVDEAVLAAARAFAPIGEEMTRLNRMAGTYRLRGTYRAAPETEAMEIAGTETFKPLYGGSALEVRVVGDELPGIGVYESWAGIGWDPAKGCYTNVYVNCLGEIGRSELRWEGERLVGTHCGLSMGRPSVLRSVLELDAKGGLLRVQGHSLTGVHPPVISFDARYERR